jgi:deoxyhypusine monooxygenase
VGYVFGQLQHPAAVGPLMKVLKRSHEHAMVRHEAAESLGSIATDDVLVLLKF